MKLIENRSRQIFATTLVVLMFLIQNNVASAEQASADDLIKSAQRVVGQVVRSAQDDPALKPSEAQSKPFWDAMKNLNESLDKALTGLILKDSTFFSSLASMSALAKQAEVGYKMNDSKDSHVAEGIESLTKIVEALDANYSKESARLKEGGDLSKGEREQLEKLKAQQAEMLKKLEEVEKNAANNNKEMQDAIKEMRRQSQRISSSRSGVGDFVGSMIAARIMSDWMWGWHWWWGPWGSWCPGFISVNVDIWDVWIDDYDYDWALLEAEIDIAELGLHDIDIDEFEVLEAESFLEDSDFDLSDGDLVDLTSDLDTGWDDVSGDVGAEIMESYEDNFQSVPYQEEFEVESFDDYGMDDFGSSFEESDMDFDF